MVISETIVTLNSQASMLTKSNAILLFTQGICNNKIPYSKLASLARGLFTTIVIYWLILIAIFQLAIVKNTCKMVSLSKFYTK